MRLRSPLPALLLLASACGGAPAPQEPAPDADAAWTFEGREAFSEGRLLDLLEPDLRRWRQEPRASVLGDAVFRLVSLYQLEGYLDVAVAVDSSVPGRVTFRIREGVPYSLGVVGYRGLRALRSGELHALEPSALPGARVAFSTRLLARLRTDILSLYGSRGYVAAEVSEPRLTKDPERGEVDAIFHIVEGPQHRIAAIEGLEGAELAELAGLEGAVFSSGTEQRVEERIMDRLRNGGHPFARAEATASIEKATGAVRIRVQVEPGPEAAEGGLTLLKTGRTRRGYVEARSGLRAGEPYSAERLRRAEDRLMATGLFRSARLQPGPVDPDTGRVEILADLDEAKPGEVALRLGYGTLDGERVGLDLSYDNLFGGAEYARVGGTYGRYGYRADAEFALRYAFGTDFRPGVAAFLESRDYPSYEASAVGGQASLSYEFTRTLNASGGVLHSDIRTTEVEPGVSPNDLLDFEYTALFFSATWDGRDVPHLPKRGAYLGGRVEWAGERFSPDLQFLNVNARAAAHVPLPFNVVASFGLQGGRIVPLAPTDDIPITLRYFAGGFGTVRGFEFASIGPEVNGEATGGELYLSGQAELRFPLWSLLHGAIFTDRGGVWRTSGDLDLDGTRWSVGGGLRLYTPAGAIVLDLGWNPSREPGEDSLELHLSVGFPF